jgi:hypothetical protein
MLGSPFVVDPEKRRGRDALPSERDPVRTEASGSIPSAEQISAPDGDVETTRVADRVAEGEFHYSTADPGPDARFGFEVVRGAGIDGLVEYGTLGYVRARPRRERRVRPLPRTAVNPKTDHRPQTTRERDGMRDYR